MTCGVLPCRCSRCTVPWELCTCRDCPHGRTGNVLRIGIETYAEYQTVINYIVTIIVFLLFWFMVFYKLTNKHTIRIQGYEEEKQLFYKFFDLKSFLIMAFMISFGIIIRSFHLLPERFIAVFYTGLGAALFMAGVLFGRNYIQAYRKKA